MTEECLTPRAMLQSESSPDPDTTLGVSSLVSAAMRDVDVELKQHILNNIVVTGSTSLLYGFSERVNLELGNLFPGPRVRLTAPGNTAERRHSVWLGGSILASLGSFHQLWISKKEYEEHGLFHPPLDFTLLPFLPASILGFRFLLTHHLKFRCKHRRETVQITKSGFFSH
jgi:actin-related protein 4